MYFSKHVVTKGHNLCTHCRLDTSFTISSTRGSRQWMAKIDFLYIEREIFHKHP